MQHFSFVTKLIHITFLISLFVTKFILTKLTHIEVYNNKISNIQKEITPKNIRMTPAVRDRYKLCAFGVISIRTTCCLGFWYTHSAVETFTVLKQFSEPRTVVIIFSEVKSKRKRIVNIRWHIFYLSCLKMYKRSLLAECQEIHGSLSSSLACML